MISKNRIKSLHALELKKNRRETGEFIGEGPKLTADLLNVFPCTYLAATAEWTNAHRSVIGELHRQGVPTDLVTDDELQRASLLQHPQEVIAVFRQPAYDMDVATIGKSRLLIALDGVQDPGNLGTIVRIADWFGIEDIFCSPLTADIYNPKSVQATMGSLARVRVHYLDLVKLMERLPDDVPVYGTFLDGHNMYKEALTPNGVIVMGNEGKGITPELRQKITRRLFIPNYPLGRDTAESLNVAVATAVICAEFRRQAF